MQKHFEGERTMELKIVNADLKSFRNYMLAHLAASNVGAMPILYRIA